MLASLAAVLQTLWRAPWVDFSIFLPVRVATANLTLWCFDVLLLETLMDIPTLRDIQEGRTATSEADVRLAKAAKRLKWLGWSNIGVVVVCITVGLFYAFYFWGAWSLLSPSNIIVIVMQTVFLMTYFVHLFVIRCKLKEAGYQPNSMTLWLAFTMAMFIVCKVSGMIINNPYYAIIGQWTQAKANAFYTFSTLDPIFESWTYCLILSAVFPLTDTQQQRIMQHQSRYANNIKAEPASAALMNESKDEEAKAGTNKASEADAKYAEFLQQALPAINLIAAFIH